jgi:hypothetical protein
MRFAMGGREREIQIGVANRRYLADLSGALTALGG